jgi:hypothetical protein
MAEGMLPSHDITAQTHGIGCQEQEPMKHNAF